MPTIGYLLGSTFEQYITSIDHWVAFVLLALIGGNMVRESREKETAEEADDSFPFKSMLLLAIAIVGSKVGETNTLVTGPCGVCRQALYEFGGPGLTVIMARSEDDYIVTTLGDLLPYGFGPANLE